MPVGDIEEEIIIRFRGISIQGSTPSASSSSGHVVRIVLETSGEAEPSTDSGASSSAGVRRAAPPARAAVLPARVERLAARLGPLGGLTGLERIQRAYTAGQSAESVLSGASSSLPPTPKIVVHASPVCYVILRFGIDNLQDPCWVSTYKLYKELLGKPFPSHSVSHSFHSQAEGTAYCIGAGFVDLVDPVTSSS